MRAVAVAIAAKKRSIGQRRSPSSRRDRPLVDDRNTLRSGRVAVSAGTLGFARRSAAPLCSARDSACPRRWFGVASRGSAPADRRAGMKRRELGLGCSRGDRERRNSGGPLHGVRAILLHVRDEPIACLAPDNALDCGYRQAVDDGACDETCRGGIACPESERTDLANCDHQVDCCAPPDNGVCKELAFGRQSEDCSGFYDSDYYPVRGPATVHVISTGSNEPTGTTHSVRASTDGCSTIGCASSTSATAARARTTEPRCCCLYHPSISSEQAYARRAARFSSDHFRSKEDHLADPICHFDAWSREGVCATPCSSASECRPGRVCNGWAGTHVGGLIGDANRGGVATSGRVRTCGLIGDGFGAGRKQRGELVFKQGASQWI